MDNNVSVSHSLGRLLTTVDCRCSSHTSLCMEHDCVLTLPNGLQTVREKSLAHCKEVLSHNAPLYSLFSLEKETWADVLAHILIRKLYVIGDMYTVWHSRVRFQSIIDF